MKIATANGGYRNIVLNELALHFAEFSELTRYAQIGHKDGAYFVRGGNFVGGSTERADVNLVDADLVILDGDKTIGSHGELLDGAPEPALVHKVLTNKNIQHCIYTTHSHRASGEKFNRYRVAVPCHTKSKAELRIAVDYLIKILHDDGVMLASVDENYRWSQAWYWPRVPDQECLSAFEHFEYLIGEPLNIGALNSKDATQPKRIENCTTTLDNQIKVASSDSLHRELISRFNADHDIDWVISKLEDNQYKLEKRTADSARLISPNSESGSAGVVVSRFEGDGKIKVTSFHGNDVKNRFSDPYDLSVHFDFGGDGSKAFKSLCERYEDQTLGSVTHLSLEESQPFKTLFNATSESALLNAVSGMRFRNDEIETEDYLITNGDGQGVLSTVDIGQVIGPTGLGKTLMMIELAVAVATGTKHLGFGTARAAKVLYIDGELAKSTLQSRIQLACEHLSLEELAIFDQNFYVLNRSDIAELLKVELSPLDTQRGAAQISYLIKLLGVRLVIFDSRFCLLAADLKEPNSMPKQLMLSMRSQKVAAIWLHHTGRDESKGGYGDSTASWLLDFSIVLSKNEDGSICRKYHKKRKCTDVNKHYYVDLNVSFCNKTKTWVRGSAGANSKAPRFKLNTITSLVLDALNNLTMEASLAGVGFSKGKNQGNVIKISRKAMHEHLLNNGVFPPDEKTGELSRSNKEQFNRSVRSLMDARLVTGSEGYLWLIN